jgi:hypothetical protein
MNKIFKDGEPILYDLIRDDDGNITGAEIYFRGVQHYVRFIDGTIEDMLIHLYSSDHHWNDFSEVTILNGRELLENDNVIMRW